MYSKGGRVVIDRAGLGEMRVDADGLLGRWTLDAWEVACLVLCRWCK